MRFFRSSFHGLVVLAFALCMLDCASTTQKHGVVAPGAHASKKKPKHARNKRKAKSKSKSGPEAPETAPEPEVVAARDPQPAAKAAITPALQQPQSQDSRIVLPVKVAFDALAEQLDALVPKTDQKDWTAITKGDESPKAEVKYQLWRDPIRITFSDRTFHIAVPVHYAANVRAQVRNPFSKRAWIWIAKDETWGTKADPQDITAMFDAKIDIDDTWQVKSETRLTDLEHGDAPSGEICKNAGIQICVPKSDVAPQVRKHIDAYLRARLEKELAKVDAEVQHAFDLQQRAQAVWDAVQAAQAVNVPGGKQSAWLSMQPSAVGIGPLEKDGAALRVDLSLAGRIAVRSGQKPKSKPIPLPKLTKLTDPAGFHVNAELRLPADALTSALTRELDSLHFGHGAQQVSIATAQVVARPDEKHPHRIVIKLALEGAVKDEIELRGELAYDAATQRLSVERFDYASDSADVLAKKLEGFDHAALRKQVAAKAHWDLAAESAPLKAAIGEALNSTLRDHLRVSGELTQLELKDFAVEADALAANVILGGELEVEYTP
jgi:hypothetical protein